MKGKEIRGKKTTRKRRMRRRRKRREKRRLLRKKGNKADDEEELNGYKTKEENIKKYRRDLREGRDEAKEREGKDGRKQGHRV